MRVTSWTMTYMLGTTYSKRLRIRTRHSIQLKKEVINCPSTQAKTQWMPFSLHGALTAKYHNSHQTAYPFEALTRATSSESIEINFTPSFSNSSLALPHPSFPSSTPLTQSWTT